MKKVEIITTWDVIDYLEVDDDWTPDDDILAEIPQTANVLLGWGADLVNWDIYKGK